jgi:DNA-binding IclR family transcriptional regulator
MDDESEPSGRSGNVKSVEVTVKILEVLAEKGRPVRVTELARHLGMTKARVSRHLGTLAGVGLVDKAKGAEGYVFGWKLLQLGRAALFRSNIADVARPHLYALRDEIGHTTVLSTPTAEGAIVILTAIGKGEITISIDPGTVFNLPNSPAARLVAYYAAPKKLGPKREVTQHNLQTFGVEFEIEPRGNGLGGVSAPVFEADGSIAAAISVVLGSALISPHPKEPLLRALRNCARAIQNDYAPGAADRALSTLKD